MSGNIDVFSNLKKNNKEEQKQNKEADKMIKEIMKEDKAVKPTDDPKEKMKLIYSIQSFGKNKRFGDYLKNECQHNFSEGYLRKLTIEELKLELEKQQAALSNRNNSSLIDSSLEKFLQFAETMVHNKTKYKIAGTTQKLYGDENFLDLIEMVKLKYSIPFVKLDPVVELSLVVLQTCWIQHQSNTFMTSFQTSVDLDEEIIE